MYLKFKIFYAEVFKKLIIFYFTLKAGDLFEKLRDDRKAMECYKAGKVYRKGAKVE